MAQRPLSSFRRTTPPFAGEKPPETKILVGEQAIQEALGNSPPAPNPKKAERDQKREASGSIPHRCGHPCFIADVKGRDCGKCRDEAARKAAAKKKEKKQEKRLAQPMPNAGRLPDGAQFDVQYHAERQEWDGQLYINDGAIFKASAFGVFGLLKKLDQAYRKSLETPEEEKAAIS